MIRWLIWLGGEERGGGKAGDLIRVRRPCLKYIMCVCDKSLYNVVYPTMSICW